MKMMRNNKLISNNRNFIEHSQATTSKNVTIPQHSEDDDDLQSITSSILQKFQSIPEKTSALIHELADTQLSLQHVKKERDEYFQLINNLTNNMNRSNNSNIMNSNNCNIDNNKKNNVDYKNKNAFSLACSTELNELRKLLHSMEKENEVLHNALEKSHNVRLQQRRFMETLLNTSSGCDKKNNDKIIKKSSTDNVDTNGISINKPISNGCDKPEHECCNTSTTSTNNTSNQTEISQEMSTVKSTSTPQEEKQEKVQINYKTFTRKNNNNANNVTIFLKPHERHRSQKQKRIDIIDKTMTRPKSEVYCIKNKEYWDQTFSDIELYEQLQRHNQRLQQHHTKGRKCKR